MLETKYLFDITTRHSLYVEHIKLGMYKELQKVLAELSNELKKLFARLRFKTLDEMNKRQLQQLVVNLRRLQSRIFGSYAHALITQIEEFMFADLSIQKRMFVTAINNSTSGPLVTDRYGVVSEEDADEFIPLWATTNRTSPLYGMAAILGGAGLWATIRNAPMPANGLTVPNFTSSFSLSAQNRIESLLRQGWANRIATNDFIDILTGTPTGVLGGIRQGSSSQIDRIFNQGSAVIDTQLQFVSQVVSAGVASAMFTRYVWNAVLDRGTCETCKGRDGVIFQYGVGPIPPAHTRCRCSTAPVGDDLARAAAISAVSLSEWLADQPEDVRQEFADSYRNGAYSPQGILTASNFTRKLRHITAR